MADQQKASSSAPPPKKIRYQQGRIESTEQLYLGEKYADVHFIFNSDDGTVTRVPAHKNLLAVASDVFARIFYGKLKEKDDITITDASAAVFKEFLQFFYLSEGDLTVEHVAGVMYLGNKYNVKKCTAACTKLLKDGLSNESVCTALSLAILYEQKELIKTCEKRILLNTDDVFKTAAFLECSEEVLAHILDMKLLSCSEVDVFEACMAWVRAKSKQNFVSKAMVKKHLGDLYYEIRFASMSMQEFCALDAKYSAVFRNDFHTIACLIVQSKETSNQFNKSIRQVKWNEDAIIECDRDRLHQFYKYYELDIEEKLVFSTNEPLLLGSFVCNRVWFGSNRKVLRSRLSVDVDITEARTLDGANVKVLANLKANLGSNFSNVSCPQPILIRPKFFYTIRIDGFPEGHYFSSVADQVHKTLDFNIKIHNNDIVIGKTVGLIFQLQFNKI